MERGSIRYKGDREAGDSLGVDSMTDGSIRSSINPGVTPWLETYHTEQYRSGHGLVTVLSCYAWPRPRLDPLNHQR